MTFKLDAYQQQISTCAQVHARAGTWCLEHLRPYCASATKCCTSFEAIHAIPSSRRTNNSFFCPGHAPSNRGSATN
eukprot:4609426-Lingulodinium_polyedra.AAC.1